MAEQRLIDQDQSNSVQFKHAMRSEGQSLNEAVAKANEFVRGELRQAIDLYAAGDREEAMRALGRAIHTLQDASSPAHEGFQEWNADWSLARQGRHAIQETQYPGEDFQLWTGRREGPASESETRRRHLLEGATRYAYDIFIQGVSNGEKRLTSSDTGASEDIDFFDPQTGALRVPSRYAEPISPSAQTQLSESNPPSPSPSNEASTPADRDE